MILRPVILRPRILQPALLSQSLLHNRGAVPLVEPFQVDSAASNTDATTFATGSMTGLPANVPIYAAVVSVKGTTPDLPTATGCGLTWTEVKTQLLSTTRRLTVFSGIGTPSDGAITFDFTNTQLAFASKVIRCPGAAVSSFSVQSVGSAGASGTTMTNTLAAFASPKNIHLAFIVTRRNSHTDIVPPATFTELGVDASATDGVLLAAMWARNEVAVSPTWASADLNCAVSVEVKSG
jgi:hypothetical protein